MYVKSTCPHCQKASYQDLAFHIQKNTRNYESGRRTVSHLVKDIEVRDSVSEEQLAREILLELEGYIYNGISTDELCKLLKKYFSVAGKYCCDIIQKLKIEMDMYCPDRQHLYFVTQ